MGRVGGSDPQWPLGCDWPAVYGELNDSYTYRAVRFISCARAKCEATERDNGGNANLLKPKTYLNPMLSRRAAVPTH